MKDVLLYIWQLPQNLLGLFVIWFSKASLKENYCLGLFYYSTRMCFGVSLGKYIIIHDNPRYNDLKHEHGHQIQSLRLGWLYLLVIGLPSALGNLWDQIFHKNWANYLRENWYYSLPWEKNADYLGRVNRW